MTLENAFGDLALDASVVAGNAILTAIAAAVADLDANTDNIEALLTSINGAVADLDANTDGIEALVTASNGFLSSISTAVDQLEGYTDGIEGLLTTGNGSLASLVTAVDQLEGYTDGLEALLTATNAALGTIDGRVDGLEGLQTTANASLASILAAVDQLEGYTDGLEALIGTSNTLLTSINNVLHPTALDPVGMNAYRNISVINTGSVVKGSEGKVYSITMACNTAVDRYVKFYNKATAPTAADTPVLVFPLFLTDGVTTITFEDGLHFSLGIGIRATTGVADANNGAPTANSTIVNVGYR